MSQIVTHSNILDLRKTFVVTTTARHSSEIVKDLLVDEEVYEVVLSKNSVIQYEPFDIKEGDIINVLLVPKGGGGGKNILSLVTMIAIAVFAPQFVASTGVFGSGGALAGYGLGFTAGTLSASLMTAGIVLAGGLLVNAVFGQQIDTSSLNSDLSSSTTYSWDESYNKFTQGLPITKVFGTHKLVPPLISKYIETIDNKQYFNGLYAVNDGEITNVTDIKINDESIENFDDVEIEIRYGTLNQPLIPNFDNVRSDKGVSRKLSTDFVETETTGNQVISLTATLLFPRGLYYANDSGNIAETSVKVVLEYSADGIAWNSLGGDTVIPTAWYHVNHSSEYGDTIDRCTAYQGSYIEQVDSLPSGAIRYSGASYLDEWYYVPSYSEPYITITDASTSTVRRTFTAKYLTAGSYQVRAKFYEQPTSSSRYGNDCYLEYITEEVGDDFIYPSTALISIRALATDQLSGSSPKISCVVTANTDNPALISKQILTEVGITSDRFLPTFDEWEDECTIKGYKCNIVFDQSVNVQKALQYIGTIGRASVVQFGSKFEVVMDRAEEIPVQSFTFGMGNILKDSFRQSFLPILDRANVLEVTYYDATNDFEPTVVEISNSNYDSVAEENRTAITLIGCTDRTQAIKHARYQLNCNRYLTETLTIEADKDSLVCKYGDIVRVSHDVPQYGFSGRIVSCTLETVTLDRQVLMEVWKSYYIQIRDSSNNVLEHLVINEEDTTDTLTFVTPLSVEYELYDNYAFGEIGKASKLYRVLKIGTKSDLTRSLELVEYNEDIYVDGGDIYIPDVSDLGLSNLRATDYIRYATDGSIESVMQLSWSGISLKYTVQYRKQGGEFSSIVVFDSRIDLVVDEATHDIIITDMYGESISLTYLVKGKLNPPDAVINVNGIELNDEWNLTWTYEYKPIDFKEFRIYSDDVLVGTSTTNSFKAPITKKKTFYSVRAVDTSNVESSYENKLLEVSYLTDVDAVSTIYQNNELIAFWNSVTSSRTISYEVRRGSAWETAQFIGTTLEAKTTIYSNGTYLIKAVYKTTGGYTIESQNASVLVADEAQLSKNVIEYFDESAWLGDKVNTFVSDRGLSIVGSSIDDVANVDILYNFDYGMAVLAQGTYTSTNVVDLEVPKLCKIYSNIEVEAININDNFDLIPDIDLLTSVDGYISSDFAVEIQISISQDGVTYDDWRKFINGDYIGQSFKMRLVLTSFNTIISPIVTAWDFTIDMPDIFESGNSVSDTSVKTVSFVNNFSVPPEVQITILNAVQGDDAILTNETEEGFDIVIKNSGANVVRTFNYFVKGY